MIEVLFFGRMNDVAGLRRTQVAAPIDGTSLHALRDSFFGDAIDGGHIKAMDVRMSVNRVVVTQDQAVRAGDEVAFFSVFSGG